MADTITSKQLLQEVENLCQTQIMRLRADDQADLTSTRTQTADATPVSHAVGKRKPSLTELDNQAPRLPLKLSRKPSW